MSAIPLRLSDAIDLYDTGIQRVFDGTYTAAPQNYKLLCEVDETNLYEDTSSAFTAFSTAKQFGENESIIYESPDQGFKKTWTQRQFGLGFAVTEMLWAFGRENIIKKLPQKLAEACARKVEIDVEDYLYQTLAGNTSYTDSDGNTISIVGGDGLSLFSKTHTREDGGTSINNFVYDGIKVSCAILRDIILYFINPQSKIAVL